MKSFALTAMSTAILAAASSVTHADFIDDSTFDIQLRTAHFNSNDGSDSWSQTSEGIQLNYKSGYFADIIGFDASYYGAVGLDHSGVDPYSTSYDRGQLLTKDHSGYHKLGQAFVKVKAGDQSRGVYSQIGYMRGKNGGIGGSSSRSTPSSYRGALVEGYLMDGWMVHGGYYDGIGQRTEASWDDLYTQSKEKIDYVWQVGSVYDVNNWRAEGFYLESEAYSKQFSGTLAYTFNLGHDATLMFEGMYHGARENGEKWDNLGFKEEANHYTFTTEYGNNGFTGTLIYGYTEARQDGEMGTLDDRFAYNDYGSSPSRIGYLVGNFWYDGEKVWQAEVGYDFGHMGLDGFNATVGYIYGSDMNDPSENQMEKETEVFTELVYAFADSSPLKGVSLTMQKGWGETKYANAPDVTANDLRAYIDYSISIF
ncbi:OprD family outer membrane porin [Candidatus Sororendozoicomonas aggregata]|uniref:OprD family outer membrane porin n=1 Tax=Candidatus Sororendozoicomonas aggregata TaxID=3073239 RepID=UPI002ED6AFD9